MADKLRAALITGITIAPRSLRIVPVLSGHTHHARPHVWVFHLIKGLAACQHYSAGQRPAAIRLPDRPNAYCAVVRAPQIKITGVLNDNLGLIPNLYAISISKYEAGYGIFVPFINVP